MRYAVATVLGLHGIAHLVGFVASWRLMTLPDLPYRTTVIGGVVDVGDGGIRFIGLLWLAAAAGCIVAAAALFAGARWADTFALSAVIASLAMCIVGWPEARIGLALNAVLLTSLLLTLRTS